MGWQGREVTVTTRDVLGDEGLIPSQYEALADDVKPGDRILLDDGSLELEVVRIAGTEIVCAVTVGGELKDHKGMNLPGVNTSGSPFTRRLNCPDRLPFNASSRLPAGKRRS